MKTNWELIIILGLIVVSALIIGFAPSSPDTSLCYEIVDGMREAYRC